LYQGEVSGDTVLRDLLGKIVLVVDKTTIPEYSKYPVCQTGQSTPCYNLSNYVNIESGGDILRSYTFGNLLDQYTTPPYIHDDGITSNVQKFKMVVPEQVTNTMNPEYYPFVLNYGVQIVMHQFYKKDLNLELYEQFFSDNLSAFVPMNLAIPYCKKQQNYFFDEWGATQTTK
jgi:hypothetical protein